MEHLHEGGRHSLFLIAPSLKVQDVSVYLQCPHQYFAEGELELILEYQGIRIYTMSFSFVPEELFGTCEGSTILITRMQGELGRKSEIKQLAAGTLATADPLLDSSRRRDTMWNTRDHRSERRESNLRYIR